MRYRPARRFVMRHGREQVVLHKGFRPKHDIEPVHVGKVRVRDKDATRERLLEAAEQVFAEKGYYGAVVDDIIRASDSSKGGFYFHFPNKEAIFLALIDLMVPKLEAAVTRAISAEHEPIAQFDAALSTALDLFTRYRRLSKILLVEAAGLGRGVDQKLMRTRGRFAALIRTHLDRAVAAGAIAPLDTELASWACFGAINEIIVRWLVAREPERLESVLPELRAMLLRSVGIGVVPQSVSGITRNQGTTLSVDNAEPKEESRT